jgi:hypothetical protein
VRELRPALRLTASFGGFLNLSSYHWINISSHFMNENLYNERFARQLLKPSTLLDGFIAEIEDERAYERLQLIGAAPIQTEVAPPQYVTVSMSRWIQ